MSVDTTTTDAAFDAAAAADNAASNETEAGFGLDETNDAASNEAADVIETGDEAELDDAGETEITNETKAEPETKAELDTGTEVTFASLGLPQPLVRVLTEVGVVKAFPIQAAAIPDALVGRDVLGRGRTGS
ncbi:MAG: DEAD/DEAH box helicase, partial [Actinocrinis sp.]